MKKGQRQIRNATLLSSAAFQVLLGLLFSTVLICGYFAYLLFQIPEDNYLAVSSSLLSASGNENAIPHLQPRLPHIPAFPTIENAESLVEDTLRNNRPTIAGIVAILNHFVSELRESNKRLAAEVAKEGRDFLVQPADIRAGYFSLVSKYLVPLDMALKKASFPQIRNDGSVFMSVAAFREHMLADTLKSAFRYATNPEKLFIGAVVQNCFGNHTSYVSESCKTGWQVVDKKRDIREMFDAPPDKNGIEEFCSDQEFSKYCEAGQIRVLYVHETEALGPAVARYFASKLWGGETYYVQVDSHLQFARGWDELYINDLHLAKSYPKAVLSTYPPGFINFHQEPPYTRGTRICKCRFSGGEGNIVRVEMNGRCKEEEERPTQMPFIGAGFVFAHGQLLLDVPYDPYLPWCFMGEEIAFSMRAWTNGWDIYAPRINLIGHHYRPLKLGLPHYWETVNRIFPDRGDALMRYPRKRIKSLVGYPSFTKEVLEKEWHKELKDARKFDSKDLYEEDQFYDTLQDLELYSLGNTRTAEEYLAHAEIDYETQTCGDLSWCTKEEKE